MTKRDDTNITLSVSAGSVAACPQRRRLGMRPQSTNCEMTVVVNRRGVQMPIGMLTD